MKKTLSVIVGLAFFAAGPVFAQPVASVASESVLPQFITLKGVREYYALNGQKTFEIFGDCPAAYYVILLFRNPDDYLNNPRSYLMNRAFPCLGGNFTYMLDGENSNLPVNLADQEYYLMIGEQDETGRWRPTASVWPIRIEKRSEIVEVNIEITPPPAPREQKIKIEPRRPLPLPAPVPDSDAFDSGGSSDGDGGGGGGGAVSPAEPPVLEAPIDLPPTEESELSDAGETVDEEILEHDPAPAEESAQPETGPAEISPAVWRLKSWAQSLAGWLLSGLSPRGALVYF